MALNIWEGELTRKFRIKRLPMNFIDYTDWLSEETTGRINPVIFSNFILAFPSNSPIMTVDEQGLEVLEK